MMKPRIEKEVKMGIEPKDENEAPINPDLEMFEGPEAPAHPLDERVGWKQEGPPVKQRMRSGSDSERIEPEIDPDSMDGRRGVERYPDRVRYG